MAKRLDIAQVLRVDRKNRVFVSQKMAERIEFSEKPDSLTIVP